MTVFDASDGLDALAVLEREKIDAVISDVLMPRMDGYRLCLEVRQRKNFNTIPFIIYTSTYTSPSDEKAALDLGADKFLKKPSPVREIMDAVHEAIQNAPNREATAGIPPPEPELMKQYNARLVAKLEHKNAQLQAHADALQKAEAQLRLQSSALEAAANAIMVTDRHGTIQWINPAFTALTGYTAEQAIGKNPHILKSGKHDPAFYQNVWQTILNGQTWQGQFTNRRKNGSFYFGEQTITPVRTNGQGITHFVGIMNDVTERKRLEEQFIQAQKMEVVGHLAGGVAHDFNNILAVIIGYSDLMTLSLAPDDPMNAFVEQIRLAGERAKGLTQQLLVFSRKQTFQPVVLDLNEVLTGMDKMLRRLIDENVELAVVAGNDLGRVKADSGYLGQVLMNLVVNARDAMPNGGKLTIETSNTALDEYYARTHAGVKPGDYVMFAVSDTGTGMTDEVKAHLFEAFFTTKPPGKGTGLGLSTCQTIVKQFGGHIGVYSEPGKGTTVRVYSPRVDQPLDTDTQFLKAGPLPRGTETLLVVEDEPALRRLASNVLETQGYKVLRASSGQDGLRVAREHKGPPIRLVVTDVIMPQMSGKVMAEWLSSIYPNIKILFTSGYTDSAIAQHGVLDLGVAFLAKPYTPAALTRKVRDMLDAV